MSVINIDLEALPLPDGLELTPQEFFELILARTVATFDASAFVRGQFGGEMPMTNVGIWFKNSSELWTWDNIAMTYVPLTHDVEVGDIVMTASDTLDEDRWLWCDGAWLSRSDYPALYTKIGLAYLIPVDSANGIAGDADDGVHFRLPNLAGRAVIGVGIGQNLSQRKRGEFGGVELVTLTLNQIPPHDHVMPGFSADPDVHRDQPIQRNIIDDDWITGSPQSDKTDPTGGDLTQEGHPTLGHNNMQPWLAMNHKIKWR